MNPVFITNPMNYVYGNSDTALQFRSLFSLLVSFQYLKKLSGFPAFRLLIMCDCLCFIFVITFVFLFVCVPLFPVLSSVFVLASCLSVMSDLLCCVVLCVAHRFYVYTPVHRFVRYSYHTGLPTEVLFSIHTALAYY